MTSEKLHDWLQLVGMAAVVASLLFVGLQLKLSQDIAVASQYQARFDSTVEQIGALLGSSTAMRVIGQDALRTIESSNKVPANLKNWFAEQPVEETAYRDAQALMYLKVLDNHYYQYQSGFLSEEAWAAYRTEGEQNLNNPLRFERLILDTNPDVSRRSFRQLISDIVVPTEPEEN
jgi:hypothetical protein